MRMGNPFSFRGKFNRKQLWLTLIAVNIFVIIPMLLPVSGNKIVLSNFSGSYLEYASPVEPVTALSWAFLFAFYLFLTALYWISVAAIVKRLHDRGKSGNSVAILLGLLAAFTLVEVALTHLGVPDSVVGVIILILNIPVILTAVLGLFGLLLLGSKN